MAKINKVSAALSHAQAYATEIIEDRGYDEDEFDALFNKINETKSIKELVAVTGERKDTVTGFYKAMLKIVAHIDYPEYSGTEDRGWYRVWADIELNSGYYSNMDLGRDVGMANVFFEYGAITEAQIKQYRVVTTLRTACNKNCMTNGRPDVAKMKSIFKPEYLDKCFDLSILYGLQVANGENVETMARLAL